MSLLAGSLRRRLRIERRAAGVDAVNQPIGGWLLVMALWGDPRGPSGMGTIKGDLPVDQVPYSWRVRYRPTGIDIGMRLVAAGVPYDIVSVRHDHARRDWTDIVCVVGGNDG